jgi:hypothetical protein
MVVEVFRRGTNPPFSEHIITIHEVKRIDKQGWYVHVVGDNYNEIQSFEPDEVEFRVTP